MPSFYYPGCKARIQVRLVPQVPEVLNQIVDPFVPGLGAEGFGTGLASQVVSLRGDTVTVDVVPLACNVHMGSYRTADTASLTFDFRHLPIEPRVVRSATVQIFGGVFWPDEFAASMGPDKAGLLLPDVIQPPNPRAGQSNQIFRGWADDWAVNMSKDGMSEVSIDARDSTGPLIDTEVHPNAFKDIPGSLPLDVVLQLLLTGDGIPSKDASRRFGFPGFRGILVVNESGPGRTPAPLPPLNLIKPPSWFTPSGKMAKGRKRKSGKAGKSKVSMWDIITDLVVTAGYICFLRESTRAFNVGAVAVVPNSELVIATPDTYYQDDPTENPLERTRVFIYGNNAEAMKIEQKLTGRKIPSIEVAAVDSSTGQLLTVRYPPAPVKNRAPPGAGDREEIKRFNHGAVASSAALPYLLASARSIYDQLGRDELRLTIDTRVLSALPQNHGDGLVADLFQLRPRDNIQLKVASENFAGSLPSYVAFSQGNTADQARMMVEAGFSPTIAARLALALQTPFFTDQFRCSEVEAQWSQDRGWDFVVNAINYLDIRQAAGVIAP